MLTYQMIYLGWVKLEADELKEVRNGSSDRPPDDRSDGEKRTD